MASKNPKVSAYVPEKLAAEVEKYRVKQGLKSTSLAVIKILEDYFGGDQSDRRMEALEGK